MSECRGACAEVDSDTEAVAGMGFKLGCISCKMRREVEATATVDWYFRAKGEADFVHFTYEKLTVSICSKIDATRGTASIVSEVMMYVSIIGLQVWLLIEMIYCYRKISAAGEEALREAALLPWTKYILLPSNLHVENLELKQPPRE
ncbi:hypothetical protein FQN60_007777 [Etheostoma spectabile]|uniref:Uncharacterized protein n=1 Tax=Etheostoma spectabile TaxID=54343 RepID=A0A5J5CUP7_9PERO|nr:hypothetical protein FQN60_007777 [Etheostoma spectabile]